MNKKIFLLIAAFAFVLLIAGAYVLYDRLGENAQPEQLATIPPQTTAATEDLSESVAVTTEATQVPDYSAPDFTVYDAEGNAVKLSNFIGKPIVLNFWASWCGPCKMEMPDFNEAFLAHGEQVQFLMVNMTDGSQETFDSAYAFIQEQGYSFPVFYDTAYDAAITYGVYSLPTTYFIDAHGQLVARASGAIDAETLQRGIGMITS